MEVVSWVIGAYVAMIVIIDPFGVVPVYLTLTERNTEETRRKIRRKASLIAAALLLVVCFTGMGIFSIFGITLPAFQIAGGILMLLLGIEQLNAKHSRVRQEEKEESMEREDISVFPLATPLLAGPGAISTVVLYAADAGGWVRQTGLAVAIVAAMVTSHLALKASPLLFRVLGTTGLNLMTRLMGILLTAIAIQFMINGLSSIWPKGS
jgi:multiple antibiotic resistance protein